MADQEIVIAARDLLEVVLQHVPTEHDDLRQRIRDWLRRVTIDGRDRPSPGERLRELVPEKLRERYHEDPIINACFATAAYGGLSRESALIQCVQALCNERAMLQAELLKLRREGFSDVVIQSPDGKTRVRHQIGALVEIPAASPAPVVHLRPDTLALLKRFATEWTDQEGCGAHVLDELAEAARRDLEPPRYVALLRQFAREWSGTERDPKTREYVGGRFDLLRELCEAFEEAELQT
jgi:hypothetical protein